MVRLSSMRLRFRQARFADRIAGDLRSTTSTAAAAETSRVRHSYRCLFSAMVEGERAGPAPVDLERELTCSICTDLLYQPLTLLDCLHTFCGACLKEWFAFQASTATSLHPYTCPSCRAPVRTTLPNATVTTLLDMFIQANPHRGKSEEEKKADREKFKYGDNVMPKLRRRGGGEAEEAERRVLEEVQQLSLREVGIGTGNGSASGSNNLEPPRERRRRERSRDRRDRSQDTRRSADDRRSRSRNTPGHSSSPREVIPPRVVEHQSSLRSLLSASELDSQEMEEEIMRQIMEEGLLDGIDLNNIDVAQEDEISERIAQAYRRRQAERQRERRERRERLAREAQVSTSGHSTPPEVRSPTAREEEQSRRRQHGRSESGTSTPRDRDRDNRPPVSRPGLLDVANQGGRTRHTRSSSQGSSRSARSEHRPTPLAVPSNHRQNLSQIDLASRPATSGTGTPTRRRQSDNQQRSTLEERQQFQNSLQAYSSSNPNSPRRSAFNVPTTTESPVSSTAVVAAPLASPPATTPSATPSQPPSSRRTTDPIGVQQSRPPNTGTPPMASPPTFPRSTTDPSAVQPRSRPTSVVGPTAPTIYPEPNIWCRACSKEHIEYDLHYNCSRCMSGDYNLCLPCYRRGKGCKHWFGFGWAAWQKYQQRAPPGGYPPNHEHPHIMRGHRYRRPQAPLTETSTPHILMSEDDPRQRLEIGVFCDICKAICNACYWKCDYCNEGEWGYCNDCVNQGRHCTHALLPISHVGKKDSISASIGVPPSTPRTNEPSANNHLSLPYPLDDSPPTTPPLTPKSASLIRGPGLVTIANSKFRPLTFTTLCNICTYPIPPSHTRYHCLKCNGGDYDICTSCYQKLVVSGRIIKEDGMHGWRRCLRGHRMIVVGFEDRDGGQRRVVVRDLVGGLSLRDEVESSDNPESPVAPRQREDKWTWRDTDGSRHQFRSPQSTISTLPSQQQQRFPPDGGVGLRVQARWSYFPAEGVTDELSFPKFAEIAEAEDINGDWFWGLYAGAKGLFPGAYGRVVGGGVERGGMI